MHETKKDKIIESSCKELQTIFISLAVNKAMD